MGRPTLPRGLLQKISRFPAGVWLAGYLLAIACFVLFVIAAISAMSSNTERRAEALASDSATIAADEMASTIQQYDDALRTTIDRLQSPAVMALPKPLRSLLLFERIAGLGHVAFVSVLDGNGDEKEVLASPEHATNWANQDYFTTQRINASPQLFIGRPFGILGKHPGITLSHRISREDGSFAGVVVAGLDLTYIRELFDRLALGQHGAITLMRNDGTLLMRLPFDANDIGRVQAAPDTQADQVPRHIAVRHIGDWPLTIYVGVATADVAGTANAWMTPLLAAGLLLALIGAVPILAWRREVSRREVAERNSRHKSDYLAMASHELRTPLHSILGNAARLRADAHFDPTDTRRIAAIITASNHLRGVLDRVLNRLHVEAQIPTPSMGLVDLRQLLDQCRAIVEWRAVEQSLDLSFNLKQGVPEIFVTDQGLLVQVLVNLLSNAIKFTDRGEVTVDIGGTAERLAIEIKDTGCGIPSDQRCNLFKLGERLGAEQRGIPGQGFGLATCRRLVECMGGDIGFRENPSGGAIFWVALPAGALSDDDAVAPKAPPRPARSLRVLVVDDVAANREIASWHLRERGHDVTESDGGADAVRLAGENDFDVVLMDMRMPGVNGIDATKQIRAIKGRRGRVPIVAVTANALDHQIVDGRHAGMVEHLVKPFSPDELLAIVERVTRQRPAGEPPEPPVVDPAVLAELAGMMSSGDLEHHLSELARNVELLLRELGTADITGDAGAIADLAHKLAGTAGTFGFAALSTAARRFEAATLQDPTAAQEQGDVLAATARAALAELRELTSAEPVGSA